MAALTDAHGDAFALKLAELGYSRGWWRLNGGEAWIGDGIENDKEWSDRDRVQRPVQPALPQH